MGIAELSGDHSLTIYSHFITYGHAADPAVTALIRDETETLWNEPAAVMDVKEKKRLVIFRITAECLPAITEVEILENTDPRNNYFRIEEFSKDNISFVDGIGCNTGYFQLDNLYSGSTTAAHEYGHTLGLRHPADTDLRGKGVPGIMYPRGTLVDPAFQYNPQAHAGDSSNGGTLHPRFRRVKPEDILQLRLHRLDFAGRVAMIGDFTSIWHPDHKNIA
ncbi:MAG: peptidase M10 [Chitinophagaceae bacterium]